MKLSLLWSKNIEPIDIALVFYKKWVFPGIIKKSLKNNMSNLYVFIIEIESDLVSRIQEFISGNFSRINKRDNGHLPSISVNNSQYKIRLVNQSRPYLL